MLIRKSESHYARNTHLVDLGPEDEGKSDAELITAADRYGAYTWDGVSHPGHFGGRVERNPGGVLIHAYID